ncbi:MAG: translocation/assembly module TamB domain-containing protein [Thermodesulfovibrionales bacterium]|nr:translocation/assembly module TamB domain-containing protein [Thermodesulfovibrionales bacterium]
MGALKSQGLKLAGSILLIALAFSAVIFVVRGPYMSNFLKKVVLREFRMATGRQVIAEDVYISVFPLFVGAKDIKAFDGEGRKVLTADTAKAYIGLSGILRGEVEIMRFFIGKPEVWTDKSGTDDILKNIRKYRERRQKRGIRTRIKTVEIAGGAVSFYDEQQGLTVSLSGADALLKLRDVPEVSVSAPELTVAFKEWPQFKGGIEGLALIKKDGVDLKRLKITSYGSEAEGSGFYSSGGKGLFNTDIELLIDSIKKMFGLKRSGEGSIRASGSISMADDIRNTLLDMDVSGSFRLETLMELLKAKTRSRLSGLLSFNGKVTGRLSDLRGNADARLRKGSLFDVGIDDLRCSVAYRDGLMRFKRGRAQLYGGSGSAEVSISLPKVKPYAVSVKVSEVDSRPFLKLIHLDNLNLPDGKLDGELSSEGGDFEPEGWFAFRAGEVMEHPLGRVKYAGGSFQAVGNLVTLSGMDVRTGVSNALFEGTFDRASRAMDFKGSVNTQDIKDLTSPYFERLHGEAAVEGSLTGTLDEPFVEAGLRASGLRIDGYAVGNAVGKVSYRKDVMEGHLSAEGTPEGIKSAYSLKGRVKFPDALKAFDLKSPDYDLVAGIHNADLAGILRLLHLNLPLKGRFDSEAGIRGRQPAISGIALVANAEAYGVQVASASFGFSYDMKDFSVRKAVLRNRESVLHLDGSVSRHGDFTVKASSESLILGDILPGGIPKKGIPVDTGINLDIEGSGTFENPAVKMNARLTGGSIEGRLIGDGVITAVLKGRDVSVDAGLFNKALGVKGTMSLKGEMPWSAELDIGRGRYDFLLGAFLKELPDDAFLSMQGSAGLRGTKNHIEADAVIRRLNAALYDHEFTNESDISVRISDRKVSFTRVSLKGEDSSFSVKGTLEAGRSYDLGIEGRASLSPLAALSENISLLRGSAKFVLSLGGDWKEPVINGGLDISDGSLGLKGVPQRLTSINGYIYVDENRVVVQRLSAKSGGGNIDVSGVLYLRGFGMEKVYMDVLINEVTVSPTNDMVASFSGNVIVRGTAKSQDVTGELRINRARHRGRVEWKTWLLATKTKEVVRKETWLDMVRLNVKAYGTDNITVDNNIASASMKADVIIRGTAGHPRIFGRLEAKEGRVYFRNNEFRIVSATADYADIAKAGPFFGIVAETFSGGYHVWLNLEGYMDRFNLTLHSDPPLDEVEILGLLTFGEFGEKLKGLEGGIGAAEAASFLTGKYQDVLEERFRDITGIDRIQIDPYVSKATGSVIPRITVSKKLAGERLFVTYSTAVGTAEDQVLKLEYFLANNVSLLGVRDERGSMGGDIKFRFQFK